MSELKAEEDKANDMQVEQVEEEEEEEEQVETKPELPVKKAKIVPVVLTSKQRRSLDRETRAAAAAGNVPEKMTKKVRAILKTKKQKAALKYLDAFISQKGWKFQKIPQSWLLANLWFDNVLDHDAFKNMLKYVKKLAATAKSQLIEDAQDIVENKTKYSSMSYKRAKKILKKCV